MYPLKTISKIDMDISIFNSIGKVCQNSCVLQSEQHYQNSLVQLDEFRSVLLFDRKVIQSFYLLKLKFKKMILTFWCKTFLRADELSSSIFPGSEKSSVRSVEVAKI